jgi:hypothetical protein
VTTEQRRTVVRDACETAALPQRRACRYLGVHRALCRYASRRDAEADRGLRTRLRELAERHPRWGCPRLFWLLRREVCKYGQVPAVHEQPNSRIARREWIDREAPCVVPWTGRRSGCTRDCRKSGFG